MADLITDVLMPAADRFGNMTMEALGGALGALTTFGPGVVADTARAAGDMVAGVEAAGSGLANNIIEAVSPSTTDFASLVKGLDLSWNTQPATAQMASADVFIGNGLNGMGLSGQDRGWSIS